MLGCHALIFPAKTQSAAAFPKDFLAPLRLCGKYFPLRKGRQKAIILHD